MPASEKQLNFASALLNDIVAHHGEDAKEELTKYVLPEGSEWEDLETLEGSEVGAAIDVLLAIKKASGVVSKGNPDSANEPASEKQIEFIQSLAESAGVEVDTEGMTRGEASEKISELKKKK